MAVQQQRELAQHVVHEGAALRVRLAAQQVARIRKLVHQRAQLRLALHLVHLLHAQVAAAAQHTSPLTPQPVVSVGSKPVQCPARRRARRGCQGEAKRVAHRTNVRPRSSNTSIQPP